MPALKVIITRAANIDDTKIYEYISDEFGELYSEKFRNKIIKLFQTLSGHPLIGRPAKIDSSVRVINMTNKNKLVYKIVNNSIVILRILHNKTNSSHNF